MQCQAFVHRFQIDGNSDEIAQTAEESSKVDNDLDSLENDNHGAGDIDNVALEVEQMMFWN